jgi:transcriptional regulator with XRE-family HTH domain
MKLHQPNLRSAMIDCGMSQADLARKLRWSEAKVSRLVRDKQGDITLTQISELATALGVSPAHLVDLEDVAQTELEKEVLRNFRAAEQRDQELARQQLRPRGLDILRPDKLNPRG